MKAAFKEAGNTDVTAHVLPGLNHLFVHDTNGFPGNYAKLPTPVMMQADVPEIIADWPLSADRLVGRSRLAW